MSGTKTILQLNSLDRTSITGSDLLLIADIRNRETKNIETSEFVNYVNNKLNVLLSGSFTGSFKGNLVGVSDSASYSLQSDYSKTSSNLLFSDDLNGTSSYSISSSNTLFSVSSSVSNHASFALSSSISDITLYAAKTSSTTALESDSSDYSFRTYLSETSSYLNYVGQDNGTVVSSSFSERSLYVPLTSDILDKDSAIVAISENSDFSFTSDVSLSVISASHAESVIYANGLLKRLLSSVEFFIKVDTDGSIIVTPTSWKNVVNISVDPAKIHATTGGFQGSSSDTPFIISFLVKYRKNPTVLDTTVNLSNVSPVVISSLELAQSNLITTSWTGTNEGAPFWYSSAYPCGLDGFVIKVIAYYWYLVGKKTLQNPWNVDLFKTILNGARISATAFCNTDDILDSGPDSILQQANKRERMISTGISAQMFFSKFGKSIDITSVPNGDTIGAVTTTEITFLDLSKKTDKIVSIASNEFGFNFVLFENGQLLSVSDEDIPALVVYNTLSIFEKNVPICNCIYYDNKPTGSYIIGHSRGIAYISASMAFGVTGLTQYDIENQDIESISENVSWTLPKWNHNTSLNKNVKSICGLSGSKYIFITNTSFTIPKNTESPLNLSVYILPTLGATGLTSPTIKTSKFPITTTLNSITRVNNTDAIAVGTLGSILYISGSNAYRVDDDRRTTPGTSLYGFASISNLTDVKVYNGKYVYVCGSDEFNTQCILSAPIPTNPENEQNWIWTGSLLQKKNGSVMNSSLNSIFLYEDQFISVGSGDDNVVYSLERISDNINFKSTENKNTKYISSGWFGESSYLLGGSSDSKPILDIYKNTYAG